MTVQVFKMTSGEEIIAKVKEDKDYGVELEAPASIRLQKTEQGLGVALVPYMPYVSGPIVLHWAAVAASGVPEPAMAGEYNRLFGSGIEIVPASALQGLQVAQ